MTSIILDLYLNVKELEQMLSNAKAGGAVQVKVALDLDLKVTGTVEGVILR